MAISESTLLHDSLGHYTKHLAEPSNQQLIRSFFATLEALAAKARSGPLNPQELALIDGVFKILGRGLGDRERLLIAIDVLSTL